jgi:hypothetical protein
VLARLGPQSAGKGFLYVKCVEDVDVDVRGELAARSYRRAVEASRG